MKKRLSRKLAKKRNHHTWLKTCGMRKRPLVRKMVGLCEALEHGVLSGESLQVEQFDLSALGQPRVARFSASGVVKLPREKKGKEEREDAKK